MEKGLETLEIMPFFRKKSLAICVAPMYTECNME